MPLNTVSATINITPVVIRTFFRHYRDKARKKGNGADDKHPADWILFDEAFNIVKAFIELGTQNTVESLQEFTNTRVPHPYWATVIPVQIPLSSCNQAADVLKSWFAEDELRDIVGGERWWQVRGLNGIDAEWVAMDDDVSSGKSHGARNAKERTQWEKGQKAKLKKVAWVEEDMIGMDKLERVMLYIHGGGYFWGSINTHRYQIVRFARKMAGRCFAVNYRKAPQYPWPCPLQDVLASYLYLIRPPKDALHTAIDPNRIVLAGDSAGGGLALTCLTILRDLELPIPAGAVLISPWVDLTHSFPSILTNTERDIIPPHGFIHKPSTLWPVPAIIKARAVPTNPVPTNTTHTTQDHSKAQSGSSMEESRSEKKSLLDGANDALNLKDGSPCAPDKPGNKALSSNQNCEGDPLGARINGEKFQVKPELEALPRKRNTSPVKVAMTSPDQPVLELRSQIQQYATNEQLTHPLVSPVLQGSLGGLCPLYIMTGDSEMLRDEIIHLAHRAANPGGYPIRKELLEGPRQAENARKYTTPTTVRLQVFDGMCHVGPTVFSFTQQSRYAYRTIAEFVNHVTNNPAEEAAERFFPRTAIDEKDAGTFDNPYFRATPSPSHPTISTPKTRSPSENPSPVPSSPTRLDVTTEKRDTAHPSIKDDKGQSHFLFVRERVDVHGRLRELEPPSELEALRVPHQEVGLIKEAPVKRWLSGQEQWDAKYKRSAQRAERKRKRFEKEAEKLMQHLNERRQRQEEPPIGDAAETSNVLDDNHRRWGPLDLVEDNPPPSAIAGRRDTPDALALLKIYFAPPDSPTLRRADAVRAAFGHRDAPVQPHRQSPSEQQVIKRIIPVHGLSMWSDLMTYFLKKSSQKAGQKTKRLKDGVARESYSD